MKKILFLTPELPYPPTSGGKLKSWKLLQFLTEHYQVSVGTILKEDDIGAIIKFVSTVKIDKFFFDNVRQKRTLLNLLKSYLYRIPLNVYRSYSSFFSEQVKKNIYDYDMVVCDHYEVFQYIPKDYQGKIVSHQHNAYYLMWQRYSESGQNKLGYRLASYFESLRVKHYEKKSCNIADLVFASPNDIESLHNLGIDRSKFRYTYHLGDDSQLQLADINFRHTSSSLLYVGTLNWQANIDGLLWFIEKVWPQLKLKNPNLIFNIIGKNPDPLLITAANAYNDIYFRGFVNDLEPYFQTSRVFVAPLQYGAGMKVKVLNAMCRGIPVVTTSVGSEGLEVENLNHLVITDNPEVMVDTISRLLVDENLWTVLQKNSRWLIRQKYTWKELFSYMNTELNLLLKQTSSEQKKLSTLKTVNMARELI